MGDSIQKSREAALLLDFYAALLTGRQAEILDIYVNEDYSLSEIAGLLNISRQAAHDAVRSGFAALGEFERRLGLVRAHGEALARSEAAAGAIGALRAAARDMREALADIGGGAECCGGEPNRRVDERLTELDAIARRLESLFAASDATGIEMPNRLL